MHLRNLLFILALAAPLLAGANERHFTFTYESAVLPPGSSELELWLTPHWGRTASFSQYDGRAEYELGILERLQTSLYLNGNLIREEGRSSTVLSLSNEWKYKLLDNVADPVGLALYAEVTGGLHQLGLEAKLIVDKRVGPFLLAFNAVGESEWESMGGQFVREARMQADLGVHYSMGHGFGVGVEGVSESIVSSDAGLESTTFLAGPVATYAWREFWLAASFLPQLAAAKSPVAAALNPGPLDLHDHERYTARLLVGFHL